MQINTFFISRIMQIVVVGYFEPVPNPFGF